MLVIWSLKNAIRHLNWRIVYHTWNRLIIKQQMTPWAGDGQPDHGGVRSCIMDKAEIVCVGTELVNKFSKMLIYLRGGGWFWFPGI